jgi:hypothetical protein
MTNEEMERAMTFIVDQQAQTAVKLDQTATKLDALAETQKRGEEKWSRTEEGIRALLAIAEIHEKEIQAQSQQIASLGETTKSTDERLNALINVVERQISNGRNGKL